MKDVIALIQKYKKTFAMVVAILVAAGAVGSGVADKWLDLANQLLTTVESDVNSE